MPIASAQFTISDLTDIIAQATEPVERVDGTLWRDTSTNALSVYRAATGKWEVVVDNLQLQSLIQALNDGTIGNNSFNALMGAATALVGSDGQGGLASAAMQTLLDNVAQSLTFGAEGLTITNKGGDYATRLAPQQLEFWKGKGAAAVRIAIFGLLQTVTASYLQVGYTAQSPRFRLGEVVFEYQAPAGSPTTGNLTCRRA